MKAQRHHPEGTVKDQAGYWVLTQHSPDWSQDAENKLNLWLSESETHRLEYQRALTLWQRLDQFKPVSFPARKAAQRLRTKHLKRRKRIKAVRLAAATGVLLLISAIGLQEYLNTDHYQTAKGQRLTVSLADGSEIVLNTDTALSVKLKDNYRLVSIQHGEAFFTVNHQASRPFDVVTVNSRIRDIGTRFNVYIGPDTTQVSVSEGEVAVAAEPTLTNYAWLNEVVGRVRCWLPESPDDKPSGVHLLAGQQLAYNNRGISEGIIDTDVSSIMAWREGRLVFEMASLQDVLNQIQRYHPVEFRFPDDKLKQIKVSASFDVDNLGLILTTLQATFPISFQWLDDSHVLIGPRSKAIL